MRHESISEMGLKVVIVSLTLFLILGQYSCSRLRAANREQDEYLLQNRLDSFRLSLRQYAAARQELPQSLEEFRSSGFAHTLDDPITGKYDWQVVIGEDPQLIKGKRGIINIHSSSTAMSSRGTPYNTW
jgi:hypothetical protein